MCLAAGDASAAVASLPNVEPDASATGLWHLALRLAIALFVLLGSAIVLLPIARRRLASRRESATLAVVSSCQLGRGQSVHLVRCGDAHALITCGNQSTAQLLLPLSTVPDFDRLREEARLRITPPTTGPSTSTGTAQ
jgi:flagellar biogenesis protein FliO